MSQLILGNYTLDHGLSALDTGANRVYLLNGVPTDYADAVTASPGGKALGYKDLGAGGVFAAPAAHSPDGRQIATNTITGGTVTVAGTPTRVAFVDTNNSRLLGHAQITGVAALLTDSWGLPAMTLYIPRTLPVGPPALPSSVTNLVARYRPDFGVTTSGSYVTGVADLSGNGNDLVPSSSNTVTLDAAGYTGSLGDKPAFKFSGGCLTCPVTNNFVGGNGGVDVSVYLVMHNYGGYGSGIVDFVGTGKPSAQGYFESWWLENGTQILMRSAFYSSAFDVSYNTNMRCGFQNNAGSLYTRVNNGYSTWQAGAGMAINGGRLLVGGHYDSNTFTTFNGGSICEVVVCMGVFNLTELDDFFVAQWGS